MLSILIGHSYFLRLDHKQFERAKPYPPLATLQAAALLQQAGHQVALFDAMLSEGVMEFAEHLRSQRPQVVLLYEDNYNFLSKMCLGRMREAACEMAALARRAGARVIAAGSDVNDVPDLYLRAGVEVALLGEGLDVAQQLLARLSKHPEVDVQTLVAGLGGLLTLVAGKAMAPPQLALGGTRVLQITDARHHLTTAPLDASASWELIDVERYREVWQRAHGFFSLNMAASKGCSFRCAWCAKPIWGSRYQQRSPDAVATEMAELKRLFRPDHVWFADDIFGFRVDWVSSFAEHLQASQGGIPFTIQTRADLISDGMAAALKQAGCREAWIGAESGSQDVLDAMDKGTTVQELLVARARLKAQGIRVGFFIQLGYLGEQLDDLLATRRLIDEAEPDEIGVSVSYPLPGTRFYEQVKAQLGSKTRWDDSGDLAMMFQGSYSSAFYRAIRDLLHHQVDVAKLKAGSDAKEHRKARAALQRRWTALLARERQFRTRTATTAVAA